MLAARTIVGLAGMALLFGAVIASADVPPDNRAVHQIKAGINSCPALPHVACWNTSHSKIITYVDQKFHGQWDPYIKRWMNYRDQMQDILDRSGTALVKSRNIRLRGLELATHIEDIELRIHVTRCLKFKYGGRMALMRVRGNVIRHQA